MTRKITTEAVVETKSDMSGREATEFRSFSFNGLTADLDMTEQEAAKLDKVLGSYVAKSHNVQVADPVLREWAQANGHTVGTRGRIESSIREAFFAAMGAGETVDAE